MTKPHRLYFRDNRGCAWYFDAHRQLLRMVGDTTRGGGYSCHSTEEALELLNRYRYVSGRCPPRKKTQ